MKREKTSLMNAERRAIKKELEDSLLNIEQEQRAKAAIKAAKRAHKDNTTYVPITRAILLFSCPFLLKCFLLLAYFVLHSFFGFWN